MQYTATSVSFATLALVGACTSTTSRGAVDPSATAEAPAREAITQKQVAGAQRAWCDALVGISKLGASGGDAKGMAIDVLSSAYGYDDGAVLFKPTLTHGAQTFRMDKQGALAYFVGDDPTYPDDHGFALKGWVSCMPEIRDWVTDGDIAFAMGNVHLVDAKGTAVTVDKTFGYKRDPAGNLKIVLHHSSLPYAPAE